MCVAIAATTTVTMVTVISQRVGKRHRESERGGIQRRRGRGWVIVQADFNTRLSSPHHPATSVFTGKQSVFTLHSSAFSKLPVNIIKLDLHISTDTVITA